jgi:anaerobic ribonucleoside-triphosphate reductase activating protein
MKVARWKHNSYAEGPRSNTTFWFSGCSLRCKGCFNPELWDGRLGRYVSLLGMLGIIRQGRRLGDRGIAFVGGEPMDQAWPLGFLCLATRLLFPELVITIYTGFRLENLRRRKAAALVLLTAHLLVDGPFVFSLADRNLGYRGSANQRVIDLVKTRKTGFNRVALENWDGMLVYDRGTLSGPLAILKAKGENQHVDQCGKY